MNTHEGYSKKTISNANVLLAGGGDKSLADFLGGIQYVSASHKILIKTAVDNASWQDLVTLVTTDENVKQTPKTDDVNRPLMMINGGTSTGEQISTSMFSTGIYANASTKTLISSGFVKTSSDDTYVLLGGGGHKALSDFSMSGHTHNYVNKYSYSLSGSKAVRITYSSYNGCFISACRSNGGGQAIWVGTGYGEQGWVRNQWRCLINSSYFKYSLPNTSSIACSIEIFHDVPSSYGAATINVWCSGNVTFTQLDTLTTSAEDATMIYAGNWSTYINLTTLNAAAADHSHTIQIGNTEKSFSTTKVTWTLEEIGAQAAGNYVTIDTSLIITGLKTFNTASNTIPVVIGRNGSVIEGVSIGVDDNTVYFVHQLDETIADFIFLGKVTDTKRSSNKGANAATKNILFALGYNRAAIYIDGATVYHTNNLKTMVASGSSHSGGLVPDTPSTAGTTKFLREDGSWQVPTYTQIPINNITGSGTSGYITKWTGTNTIGNLVALSSTISSQTQSTKFLREDGTWATPSYTTNTNTTYTISTGDGNGQIKVTPSVGNAYNVDVKGLGTNAYNSDIFVKRYTYAIKPSKGVRITYGYLTPVLIHAGRTNGGSQLILIGAGYGEAGWVRNSWRCLIDTGMFYWSLPGDSSGYAQAIEIFHNSSNSNGTITVWSTDSVTFTDINALTSTRDTSHVFLTAQDHYKTSPTAGTAGTSSSTSGSTLAVPYITINADGHITGYGTHTHTISGFLTELDHYKTSITAGTAGTSSNTSGSTLAVPYITMNASGHVTGYGTHTHTISGFALTNHVHKELAFKDTIVASGNANNFPNSDGYFTMCHIKNGASNWPGTNTGDGELIWIPWSTSAAYGTELAVGADKTAMLFRRHNGSSWEDWNLLIHNNNISPSLPISGTTIAVKAGGVTSSYITVPYAGYAGYISNFRVSTYTIPANKAVRITYPGYVPVLISVQRSNGGGLLILLGGGYGEQAWVRNNFVELVKSSLYTWCLGDASCTVEISGTQYGGDLVQVWTSSSVTFTEISAITRADNNKIILSNGDQSISGNLTCTNFYTTSDRNKKTNISSFSEHIRKFQLKDTEKWHYGVIAQEVEEMFRDGEEGNMTVNYNSILSFYIGLLENKVKMLEERIKRLESK